MLEFLVFFASSEMAVGQGDEGAPWLQKDKADLERLWTGDWSNDRHVFFAEDAGMDADAIGPRQSLSLRVVDKSQADAAPLPSTPGQLAASFSIEDGAVVQRIAQGKDECVIHWRRDGAQFSGQAQTSACQETVDMPAPPRAGMPKFSISETELWVSSSSRRGDGSTEARFRKVRPFQCWVAILRGASHGDSGRGSGDWFFQQGVELHDQGGIAAVTTDEDPARTIRLQLRDVEWTYGTRRPSLTLYVLEGDEDRAVSYSWTEGGADRIGLNLRWIQASCTREGAED